MRYLSLACLAATTLTAQAAWAAPTDLTTWVSDNRPSLDGGSWSVAPDGLSVTQGTNTDVPTVFYEAGSSAHSQSISATMRISNNDDDIAGFVLGYQTGEFTAASAEYWLLSWTAGTNGSSTPGLSLQHVVGEVLSSTSLINGLGPVQSVTAAMTLGSTGWARDTTYAFDVKFRPDSLDVTVDGVLQFSETGVFSDGAFGFYNLSQSEVTYTADISPAAPVPVPASLLLLLAGLGGLAWGGRKPR